MIRGLLLAAAVALAPAAAFAQSLTVTNSDGKVTTFTAETLKDLPRASAPLAGKTVYEGPDFAAVLREAGVAQGPRLHGKPLVAYVVVKGKDGYRAVFSIAELDPAFRPGAIILADRRKDGPLDADEGPWRLVLEAEAKPERSVRQVESVTVVAAP